MATPSLFVHPVSRHNLTVFFVLFLNYFRKFETRLSLYLAYVLGMI